METNMSVDIIDLIKARSENAIKEEDGDYIGADGLLYCGKCNTPKQTIISACGKPPRCVNMLCECEKEREEKKKEAAERRAFAEKVQRYRKMGFPQSQMEHWTFENDDGTNEKLTDMAKRYVENFRTFREEGKGLLLYGDVGTGKTYIACMIANALIDKGYPVLVTNFARILSALQSTYEKQEYLDSLNEFALLVIDDLGIERDTSYAKEQVFNIIDSRYRSGKPMIITTNLTYRILTTETELANKRVYDRIIERCHPIKVSGESRRTRAQASSYSDMKKLLGI